MALMLAHLVPFPTPENLALKLACLFPSPSLYSYFMTKVCGHW